MTRGKKVPAYGDKRVAQDYTVEFDSSLIIESY